MDRLKMVQIAQRHAVLSGHNYAKGSEFVPHDWVIDAMQEVLDSLDELREESFNEGYDSGSAEGYASGYNDGSVGD